MSEDPKEILNKHLTHSVRLGDIDLNLNTYPLDCGIPTIEKYEYLMKGEGTLIIMSARPGNGKSALAAQISLNVSKHSRALYISLEMKNRALRKRLLAVTSGVPIKKLTMPQFKEKVEQALKEQNTYKLDLIDEDGLSVDDIIRITHDEHRRDPLSLLTIDYLGLVKMDNSNRALAMSQVAKRLKKEIAEPLKIPVLALAQMKRGFEDRYSKAKLEYEKGKNYNKDNPKIMEIRPSLEDLGESSGLEHNADVVMFLHRPYLLDPEESPSLFKVYLAKNRNGEVKDFELEFSQELTKFIDRKGEYL